MKFLFTNLSIWSHQFYRHCKNNSLIFIELSFSLYSIIYLNIFLPNLFSSHFNIILHVPTHSYMYAHTYVYAYFCFFFSFKTVILQVYLGFEL